jgi:hypothetical protein
MNDIFDAFSRYSKHPKFGTEYWPGLMEQMADSISYFELNQAAAIEPFFWNQVFMKEGLEGLRRRRIAMTDLETAEKDRALFPQCCCSNCREDRILLWQKAVEVVSLQLYEYAA